LAVLAILIGIVAATVYTPNENSLREKKTYVSDFSASASSDESYFSASELPFASVTIEHIPVIGGSVSSFRVLPDTFMFRIIHSGQLANEHFFAARFFYTTLYAQKQAGGYYLFYLCKLLI
jgi:hypothetical protein